MEKIVIQNIRSSGIGWPVHINAVIALPVYGCVSCQIPTLAHRMLITEIEVPLAVKRMRPRITKYGCKRAGRNALVTIAEHALQGKSAEADRRQSMLIVIVVCIPRNA